MALRFLTLALVLWLTAFTARAQPTASDEPPGYGEAVEAALVEHERGQYIEARAHMLRAHAIFPNARTLRGLGKLEYELSNYVEALDYLDAALSSTVKPLDDSLRAEVAELARRAREHVGEVRIAVDPPSAAVVVDSAHARVGPDVTLVLPAGDHVLEFRAEGRAPERRPLRIKGGEQTSLVVVLHPVPPALPASLPEEPERARLRKNPWLWVAVGALAGGCAAALTLALTRDTEHRAGDPVQTPNSQPGVVIHAGAGQ